MSYVECSSQATSSFTFHHMLEIECFADKSLGLTTSLATNFLRRHLNAFVECFFSPRLFSKFVSGVKGIVQFKRIFYHFKFYSKSTTLVSGVIVLPGCVLYLYEFTAKFVDCG